MLGLETIYGTIPNLVKSCDEFQLVLVEYKKTSMARMNVTKESAKKAISNMVARKADVQDASKLTTYYIFLGMMHELNDDPISAVKLYEESIKVNPNITAKALQALLLSGK
jgi:hypothetical protein